MFTSLRTCNLFNNRSRLQTINLSYLGHSSATPLFHPSTRHTTTAAPAEAHQRIVPSKGSSLVPSRFIQRMILTGEITVSKLFPAGFGWQAASVAASWSGFGATDVALWLATGVGDALGVFLGHMIYMIIKKSIFTSKKSLFDEFGIATWLGTAAFCSGTLWQPSVNFFGGLGLAFPSVALLTALVCASAFCVGLRLGRRLYTGLGIEKPHYRNFTEDAGLSLAIGGASGMFVGTDVTIPKNPFDSFVGVYPDMDPLTGCFKAGTSTAVGFAFFHSIQNTRAQSSAAYVTQAAFKNIAASLIFELEQSVDKQVLRKFVETEVDALFVKLDHDGDGKLTHEEVEQGLAKLVAAKSGSLGTKK